MPLPLAEPPLCVLILVECLVTEDAPNRLIGMGQQLTGLKLQCQIRDCGSHGVSGLITPGVMAWRESCRDDRGTSPWSRCQAGLVARATAQGRRRFASVPGSKPQFPRCCAQRLRASGG